MQTFLPYPSFEESVKCLDRLRLGKQRVEALQLLNALVNGGGWSRHPAARMWEGYTNALATYGIAACRAWISRGYRDTCEARISAYRTSSAVVLPPWLGREDFHAGHRSNLLRKDPLWYGKFGWTEGPDLPYIWPSK